VLRSFGPNSIIVFKFPVGFRVGNLSPEERTRKNLTYENAVHIQERCDAVEYVSPMLFPNKSNQRPLQGQTTCTMSISSAWKRPTPGKGQVDLHMGRFFTDEESRHRLPVAWWAPISKRAFFANLDPSARPSTWTVHEFTVIGTMLRPAASFSATPTIASLVPYGHDAEDFPNARENAIVVSAVEGKAPAGAG